MEIPEFDEKPVVDERVARWTILSSYRGSKAHGTFLPGSNPDSIDDIDLMTIIVGSQEHYLGLRSFGTRGTQEIKKGPWDIVVYDVLKFVRLLAQGNPNVISILWNRPSDHVTVTPAGQMLIANRTLFDGKHIVRAFLGYAQAQMKKMRGGAYQGYMGAKRKALFDKFGYDTKNAQHMIRLLRMCAEYVETREFVVARPDRAELLAIKLGEWSLDAVEREAERLEDLICKKVNYGPLPEAPNMDAINALCPRLIRLAWETRGARP